eukprot:8790462-Ditylum_brightwellii.AAC.1
MINHCKQEYDCKVIGDSITKAEWCNQIAIWDKRTTTSPSGCHLEHFKALQERHCYDPSSEEGKKSDSDCEAIIESHVALTNYALKN